MIMKKISLIALLTLMMTVVSFQGKAQEVSSVTITGFSWSNHTKYKIEIVKPQYEVETKEFKAKDGNFHALLKQELDVWLKKGFKIVESNSSGSTPSASATFNVMFILIKEE
jgi:hypothetical protein